MNHPNTLSSDDRNFLDLISHAIFANPFSDERGRADALIAGDLQIAGEDEEIRLGRIIPKLEALLDALGQRGAAGILSHTGTDRTLVERAWLFYHFHRHLDRFDALIETQVAAQ